MLSKSQRSGMKGISSLSLLPLIIGSLLLLQHNFLENNIKICLENSQKTQASSLDVHFQKRDEIFKMYNTCNLVEHWFPLLKIIFQNCILTTRFPTVKKKKKVPQITWIFEFGLLRGPPNTAAGGNTGADGQEVWERAVTPLCNITHRVICINAETPLVYFCPNALIGASPTLVCLQVTWPGLSACRSHPVDHLCFINLCQALSLLQTEMLYTLCHFVHLAHMY